MEDKENIDFYSRMDRPIPGEGLLTDPESPWPWEKPPRFTSVLQASEYIFDELIDEDLNPIILDALDDEVPVMDITRFILFRPKARNYDNEIFAATLFKELGFLSPKTFKVKVEINNVSSDYIFQENLIL